MLAVAAINCARGTCRETELMATTSYLPVIFAADTLQLIIGAVVFFFYIIGQLYSAREKKKAKPARPRPQRAPQRAPVGEVDEAVVLTLDTDDRRPGGAPPDQAESLRTEIEDFVRRTQERASPQREPAEKQPLPRQPLSPQVPASLGRSHPSLGKRPNQHEPQQPDQRQDRQSTVRPELEPRSDGVAQHVSKHLGSNDVAEHAQQLGSDLGQTGERAEQRLHTKFDHQVGSLQQRETSAEKETLAVDAVAEIAALLRSPTGMRQLIIANEILRRPD